MQELNVGSSTPEFSNETQAILIRISVKFALAAAIISVLAAFWLAHAAFAADIASGWHILKGAGGAGGNVTGINIAADGTKVARADTYGAYYWNPSATNCGNGAQVQNGCWQQIVLHNNLPSGDANEGTGVGSYEIVVCDSNTSHFYMYYGSRVYSGKVSGGTVRWTRTNFSPLPANGNDNNHLQGRFMACDHANENILVIGTPYNAVFYTTDGGTSFTAVNSIPPSTGTSKATSSTSRTLARGPLNFAISSCIGINKGDAITVYETGAHGNAALSTVSSCGAGTLALSVSQVWGDGSSHSDWTITATATTANTQNNSLIAYDPTTCGGGSCTTWYATSYGNGVYKTTSGPSGTWLLVSNSPTKPHHLTVDKFGSVWETDEASASANKCAAPCISFSPVAALSGITVVDVAVDPASGSASAATIAAINAGGSLYVSTNGGRNFNCSGCASPVYIANDIPWIAFTDNPYVTSGSLAYDPSRSHVLYYSTGFGVLTTTPSTVGTHLMWTSQSAAISQLVSNKIISPPGGKPVFFAWDYAAFYVANRDQWSSTHGCVSADGNIMAAWSGDYASSDPTTIVALCDWGGKDKSGISTDGGQTFRSFASKPPHLTGAGCIAAASPTNILWVTANGGTPYYTKNGGSSWSAVHGPAGGWPGAYYNNDQPCAADRVNANTLYLYSWSITGISGGADAIYMSSDGGDTWTRECMHCGERGENFDGGEVNLFGVSLQAMPGHAGEIFFAATGDIGCAPSLWQSMNFGARWVKITNISSVCAYGFGKSNGESHSAVYCWCGYRGTNGLWRSNDNGASWSRLGSDAFPLSYFSQYRTLQGDSEAYGLVYMCSSGNACVYGQFNYLLEHDLDPATNDSNPAWVPKVG